MLNLGDALTKSGGSGILYPSSLRVLKTTNEWFLELERDHSLLLDYSDFLTM